MLYLFKSQASGDVVMLEANARQLLEIIGKSAGPQGIIQVDQIPAAVSALESAAGGDTSKDRGDREAGSTDNQPEDAERHVGLRQRAMPLIQLLKRSQAEGKDVVWGV